METHLQTQKHQYTHDSEVTAPRLILRNIPTQSTQRSTAVVVHFRAVGEGYFAVCTNGQAVDEVIQGETDDGVVYCGREEMQSVEGEGYYGWIGGEGEGGGLFGVDAEIVWYH
jgi:hypothetical protein